jgi:RNA polymerase sigma-70 factor, ECF subfamily
MTPEGKTRPGSGRRMISPETSAHIAKEPGEHSATGGNMSAYNGRYSFAGAYVVKNSATTSEPRLRLFEEVMLPHLNAAYNLARWLTRNEDDAQDVVQEAYLRAFRFFDSYRGGDGKSWLLEVVRNTCFTLQRREKRNMASVVFDEATHTPGVNPPNAEEALVEAGDRAILRNCIERLPDAFREILVMRELEEMSYRQIADVAGLPTGTVMSRLSRARKRLEECAKGRDRESDR